jgi:hypothetical protein
MDIGQIDAVRDAGIKRISNSRCIADHICAGNWVPALTDNTDKKQHLFQPGKSGNHELARKLLGPESGSRNRQITIAQYRNSSAVLFDQYSTRRGN